MTALRDPQTDKVTSIVCDHPGCSTVAPRDTKTLLHGGLRGLGWYCAGGSHLCPQHAEQHAP